MKYLHPAGTKIMGRGGHSIDSIEPEVIESHLSVGKMFAGLTRNYLSTGHFQLAAENLSAARNAFAEAQRALQSYAPGADAERRVRLEAAMARFAVTLAELSAKVEGTPGVA